MLKIRSLPYNIPSALNPSLGKFEQVKSAKTKASNLSNNRRESFSVSVSVEKAFVSKLPSKTFSMVTIYSASSTTCDDKEEVDNDDDFFSFCISTSNKILDTGRH